MLSLTYKEEKWSFPAGAGHKYLVIALEVFSVVLLNGQRQGGAGSSPF